LGGDGGLADLAKNLGFEAARFAAFAISNSIFPIVGPIVTDIALSLIGPLIAEFTREVDSQNNSLRILRDDIFTESQIRSEIIEGLTAFQQVRLEDEQAMAPISSIVSFFTGTRITDQIEAEVQRALQEIERVRNEVIQNVREGSQESLGENTTSILVNQQKQIDSLTQSLNRIVRR
jgi:hypothetical protein